MKQSRFLTLISFSSTILAPVFLMLLKFFPHPYAFASIISIWAAYYIGTYIKYNITKNQIALQIMTAASFVTLLFLTESNILRWLLIIFSAAVFFFIAFWAEPRIDHALHIKEKPLRRMMMMVYVFNVYALLVGLFAISLYFQRVSFVILALIGATYSGFAAYMIWRLYYRVKYKELFLWASICGIIVYELMWVMKLLPFGYLALGLLIAWIWYIMQLFVRFHMSTQGIIWKNQISFLTLNVVLYILLVYLIKWI